MGIGRAHDYAMGGAIACRPQAAATGDGGYPYILRNALRPGSPGVTAAAGAPYNPQSQLVMCNFGLNDLGILGANKPAPFQTALRTIMARFAAASVFEVEPLSASSSAWVFTGTWSDLGIPDSVASSGGTGIRYTTTSGDKATFTLPADVPASRVVGVNLWVNAAWGAQIIGVRVLRGGSPLSSISNITFTGTAITDQTIAGQNIIHTVRFGTGLSTNTNDPMGGQTLQPGDVIELTATSGNGLALDSATVEADPLDGPIFVNPLLNKPANYSIWSTWPGAATMNDAAVDAWKDYQRAIHAEFPNRVIEVDFDDAALVKTTDGTGDFISDGAHPNERGHGKLSDLLVSKVKASTFITDRVRMRPFVDPRPRNWKKVGQIAGGGTFGTGWSNSAGGLPELAWRVDASRRVFVRGAVKATTGAVANILGANQIPKPQYSLAKPANLFDGSAWSSRPVRVLNTGALSNMGTTVTTAGNNLEFDFDYQGEL